MTPSPIENIDLINIVAGGLLFTSFFINKVKPKIGWFFIVFSSTFALTLSLLGLINPLMGIGSSFLLAILIASMLGISYEVYRFFAISFTLALVLGISVGESRVLGGFEQFLMTVYSFSHVILSLFFLVYSNYATSMKKHVLLIVASMLWLTAWTCSSILGGMTQGIWGYFWNLFLLSTLFALVGLATGLGGIDPRVPCGIGVLSTLFSLTLVVGGLVPSIYTAPPQYSFLVFLAPLAVFFISKQPQPSKSISDVVFRPFSQFMLSLSMLFLLVGLMAVLIGFPQTLAMLTDFSSKLIPLVLLLIPVMARICESRWIGGVGMLLLMASVIVGGSSVLGSLEESLKYALIAAGFAGLLVGKRFRVLFTIIIIVGAVLLVAPVPGGVFSETGVVESIGTGKANALPATQSRVSFGGLGASIDDDKLVVVLRGTLENLDGETIGAFSTSMWWEPGSLMKESGKSVLLNGVDVYYVRVSPTAVFTAGVEAFYLCTQAGMEYDRCISLIDGPLEVTVYWYKGVLIVPLLTALASTAVLVLIIIASRKQLASPLTKMIDRLSQRFTKSSTVPVLHLLLIIMIILSASTSYSENGHEDGLKVTKETSQAFLKYTLWGQKGILGVVNVKWSSSGGIPLDIVITIDFYKPNIENELGSLDSFMIVLSYNLSYPGGVTSDHLVIDNFFYRLRVSSLVENPGIVKAEINELALSLVASSGNNSLYATLDIARDLKSLSKDWFVKGLEKHLFRVEKNVNHPGCVEYKLLSGNKVLGIISVTTTGDDVKRHLRLSYEVFSTEFAQISHVDARVVLKELGGNGRFINYTKQVVPGTDFVLPGDARDLLSGKIFEVVEFEFDIRIPYYNVSINVLSDTGPLILNATMYGKTWELKAILINEPIVSNGWALVSVGFNDTIKPGRLGVKLEPFSPLLIMFGPSEGPIKSRLDILMPVKSEKYQGILNVMRFVDAAVTQKKSFNITISNPTPLALETRYLDVIAKPVDWQTIVNMEMDRLRRLLEVGKFSEKEEFELETSYLRLSSLLEKHKELERFRAVRIYLNETSLQSGFVLLELELTLEPYSDPLVREWGYTFYLSPPNIKIGAHYILTHIKIGDTLFPPIAHIVGGSGPEHVVLNLIIPIFGDASELSLGVVDLYIEGAERVNITRANGIIVTTAPPPRELLERTVENSIIVKLPPQLDALASARRIAALAQPIEEGGDGLYSKENALMAIILLIIVGSYLLRRRESVMQRIRPISLIVTRKRSNH